MLSSMIQKLDSVYVHYTCIHIRIKLDTNYFYQMWEWYEKYHSSDMLITCTFKRDARAQTHVGLGFGTPLCKDFYY